MTQEIGGGGLPLGGSAPQLHSVRDAAKILGGVSERFVWQLVHDGVLTRVRIGSRTLIRDDELARYIETNTER